MVNCKEGPDPNRIHSTAVDPTGLFAVTQAKWDFETNEQVFENYGQPNWIYLLYHGFVLRENAFDCLHLSFNIELNNISNQTLKEVTENFRIY